MSWDAFLEKIADAHCLDQEEREAFLKMFAEKGKIMNVIKLASILNISVSAVKKRMTGVYEKFAQTCPDIEGKSPGKSEILQEWLNHEYSFPSQRKTTEPSTASSTPINWKQVCLKVLAEQQKKQRLRRKATEQGFELNVHVPLGLLERKQQQRRSGDVSLTQVYQLTQEVTIKEYQHDDFLKEVIGQSQNSKGKHVAIIGEPGAGKTTLLEEIATDIQKNDKGLPICISLGGLQGKTLEDYLLQKWLKEALRFIDPEAEEITSAMEKELKKQFCQGGVWLLLDGVDEMAVNSPVEALAKIQAQLIDWLASARVVLTCRLNVWDASVNNTLTGFDTYKTLEFTNKQLQEFIQAWFETASQQETTVELKSQIQLLGKQLQTKLKEAGRDRIRQLVRNPLRLSLLCQTFYIDKSGELPDTKAKLYQRFTRYFYEWKQNQLEITRTEQRELHQALGKLALLGIDSTARFRLGESLVCEVMGEPLFNLACELGWLNLVDREATNDDEPVYAFFHPTFQEYFAALVLPDWDFFLPRNHKDEPVEDKDDPEKYKPYRIFKPEWKEVVLLWLGQENEKLRQQKEEFIKALVDFEDGCKDFYRCQAYFLAATGITELLDFSRADEIVEQLVKWGFGSPLHIEQQEGQISFQLEESISLSLTERASAALRETEPTRAIKFLAERLDSIQNQEIYLRAIQNHEQIDAATRNTFNFLARKLLEQSTRVAYNLGKINFGNQKAISAMTNAINALIEEVPTSREALSPYDVLAAGFCLLSAYMLLEISPSDPKAINTINHVTELLGVDLSQADITSVFPLLMSFSLTDSSRWQYGWDSVQSTFSIGNNHQQNHINIKELVAKIFLQATLSDAPEAIVLTDATGQTSIAEFLRTSKDKIGLCLTAFMLASRAREICAGNSSIANALIYVLQNNQDSVVRLQVSHSLKAILTEQLLPIVVTALKGCLQDSVCKKDYDLCRHCDDIISYCAQNMAYPEFHKAWHYDQFSTLAPSLNLANFPQALAGAIANDLNLSQTIRLICIDGSKFIDRDIPAAYIYTRMVKASCPKCEDGTPKTMAELQAYWDLLESDRILVLVFYENLAGCSPPQSFSHIFLDALSRFDGAICVVTAQPISNIPLQQFSTEQPQLIEDIVGWIRAIALES